MILRLLKGTKPAQAQDSQDSWWTKCWISCTGPRFPRIPRFWGTIRQDPDKVPKNLGILGNLGPVHESCTLFIRILGNLGPAQVWWAFSIIEVTKHAQAQDSQESRWTKCRIHAQAQDSQESQDFQELSSKTLTKFQKVFGFLGILGLCMNPALCSSGFLGILGQCRFGELSPSLKSQILHRPKILKNPDEQSAGFMHRPKIPKNPKIFRNYQARPWQSSKKSWDSWESWACAWILHFVHRDSWESWACAGFMKVLCEILLFIRKKCIFPVFFDGEPQNLCRGSSFSGRNFENGEPDSGFALLGVF